MTQSKSNGNGNGNRHGVTDEKVEISTNPISRTLKKFMSMGLSIQISKSRSGKFLYPPLPQLRETGMAMVIRMTKAPS